MGLFSRPTTVDAALAPLMTAISDLETVNTDRLQDASTKEEEADRLKLEAACDRNEAVRAQLVLAKLKGLTGIEEELEAEAIASVEDNTETEE